MMTPGLWHEAWHRHWPEYLIEGWALGMFMLSAATFGALLESTSSPAREAVSDPAVRRALAGLAMGLTAIALFVSPWGRRSGAHMNPAVTLGFWSLGKVRAPDAAGYIAAQFAGGTLGVLVAVAIFGEAFTRAPVSYVLTLPGSHGTAVAFAAEALLAFAMLTTVLALSSRPHLARYTPYVAGTLVAAFITFEAPLSGMSINPARSFASALPAGIWTHLWIYVTAPTLGMLTAAALFRSQRWGTGCAKLLHTDDVRCIHCGYEPRAARPPASSTLADRSTH